jgi:hypothetical protein
MALREFSSIDGRKWRVWDVTPEKMHPGTRSEDFLSEYIEGWLVFESVDGDAKCRLTPIPAGWENSDENELRQLLKLAEPVRGERTSGPHGRAAAEEALHPHEPGSPARSKTRTFRYPGGRFWTVNEYVKSDTHGATRNVLRFSSGARSLESTRWPKDWEQLSDAGLAELLARSFPRDEHAPNETPFRRRASDSELR